jgi:uncharacterized transporter YbjL
MSNNQKFFRRVPFLAFVVCMFAGILLGFVWNILIAGILVGLGTGLILLALLRSILYRKKGS